VSDDAKPQSTRLSVLIPFGIVTLIWGSTWIVITGQLGQVPPSWSVAYRFAIGGAAMLGWGLWRREPLRLDARGLRFAAVLGLMQFVLNFNFVYRAELYVTSGLVAVVFALLLVPNAVLSRIFLGQRMGLQLIVGSVIAMSGIALLFVHEARIDSGGAARTLTGIAITIAGVCAASVANVMQATQTARAYPMAAMLGWAMLWGASVDAAFAWVTTGPPRFDFSLPYVAGLLYLGLAASALAFTLYFGVIRTIGPAKAAYSGVLVPVIAMALSTVFEGYRWSLLAGVGAALAMTGLVVALRARRPNR
jgi:drug/metabolite transporter (DMT)-like permease